MKPIRLFAIAVALLTFSIVGLVFGATDSRGPSKETATAFTSSTTVAQTAAPIEFRTVEYQPSAIPDHSERTGYTITTPATTAVPRDAYLMNSGRRGLRFDRTYNISPDGTTCILTANYFDDEAFPNNAFRGAGADTYARARI